jgi:hypothetical protein
MTNQNPQACSVLRLLLYLFLFFKIGVFIILTITQPPIHGFCICVCPCVCAFLCVCVCVAADNCFSKPNAGAVCPVRRTLPFVVPDSGGGQRPDFDSLPRSPQIHVGRRRHHVRFVQCRPPATHLALFQICRLHRCFEIYGESWSDAIAHPFACRNISTSISYFDCVFLPCDNSIFNPRLLFMPIVLVTLSHCRAFLSGRSASSGRRRRLGADQWHAVAEH